MEEKREETKQDEWKSEQLKAELQRLHEQDGGVEETPLIALAKDNPEEETPQHNSQHEQTKEERPTI